MSSLSQQPPAPSNPSNIPHPTTPSKRHGASNGSQGGRRHHGNYPGDGRSTPLQPIPTAHGQTAPVTDITHKLFDLDATTLHPLGSSTLDDQV